jgi:superfamily II DNA or RNA helicase
VVLSFFAKGRGVPDESENTAKPGQAQVSLNAPLEGAGSTVAEPNPLDGLAFRYPFRKYQQEIIELVKLKLERGERQLHIVAPPGAGKTIIGLQLIAEFKQPALVVCPTTTIQAQWGQKLELFVPPQLEGFGFGLGDIIGTHDNKPLKPVTMLTYQVLSLPGSEHDYLQKLAHDEWVKELTTGSSLSRAEGELRIMELLQNNKKAYDKELSRHVSRLRRRLTDVIDLNDILHKNAIALLQALRRQNFKVVIFDECHHLTDYWAAIMTHVVAKLDDAIVIGLTGTPPEGKSASQETRYLTLVGDIDYQVPTPALVREGGLAPFQDLCYFTEPTDKEDEFLESQHQDFHVLIDELLRAEPPQLHDWVWERINQSVKDKKDSYLSRRTDLQAAMIRFAWKYKVPMPLGIELSDALRQSPLVDDWMLILEDFALNSLKVSAATDNHKLYERIRSAIMKLGFGLTERGVRKQASPVDRVLAFSRSKSTAVANILTVEYKNLDDRLRAAVVTDFEKMSATSVKTAKGVLTAESGGAVAVMRELLQQPIGHYINPCMVTGSLLLVDRRIADQFVQAAKEYLAAEGYKFNLEVKEREVKPLQPVVEPTDEGTSDEGTSNEEAEQTAAVIAYDADVDGDYQMVAEGAVSFDPDAPDTGTPSSNNTPNATVVSHNSTPAPTIGSPTVGAPASISFGAAVPQADLQVNDDMFEPFVEITAGSADWEARLYVGMATALLERGITKCLIGTRGIFGEGWDCQALNTLIDLTTTTTPMSVKQLRGRSIRLNVNDPLGTRKVANNWDVVCIAPHLEKGLNDYQRFVRKHQGYFGISDDGQIECGVGHVHPSFSELTPAEVFQHAEEFNNEMTDRALCRDQIYDLWKVGKPYQNRCVGCIEVGSLRKLALTPPNIRRDLSYNEHAQLMRASLDGLWFEYGGLGSGLSGALALLLLHYDLPAFLGWLPLISAIILGRKKYVSLYNRLKSETCRPNTQESSLVDMSVALLSALQQVKLLPRHIDKTSIQVTQRSDGSFRVFLDGVEPEHSDYFAKSMRELLAPVINQPFLIPKYEFSFPRGKEKHKQEESADSAAPILTAEAQAKNLSQSQEPEELSIISSASPWTPREATNESFHSEDAFFKAYLKGQAQPRVAAYHAVPSLLARSERGREAFESAWNKYVSPGVIVVTEERPELLRKYFGLGPSLAQRLLWE